MLYNIALIPPKSICESAVAMSKTLSGFGSEFILDRVNYYPHLTLYLTDFEQQRLSNITNEVMVIASGIQELRLSADKFYINDSDYIDISYVNSPQIAELHERVIDKLSTMRNKQEVNRASFEGEHAEEMYQNACDIGYAIGHGLYRPHITLTKQIKRNTAALDSIKWQDFDFSPTAIGIFEADDLGCCRRLLQEFTLPSPT